MSKVKVPREVDNHSIKGFREELYYAIHLAVTGMFGPSVYEPTEGMSGESDPEFLTIVDPDTDESIRMPLGSLSIGEFNIDGTLKKKPLTDDERRKKDYRRRNNIYDDEDEELATNINISCYYDFANVQMILEVDAPKTRKEEADALVGMVKTMSKTRSYLQHKVLKIIVDDNEKQTVSIIPVNKIKNQDVFIYSEIRTGLIPIVSRLTGKSDNLGINNKYSLLLHGKGGTGKTSMMFNYVSPIAIENGYTVIFCENAKHYEKILDIAEVLVSERGWKVITIVEDIDQAFDGEIRGEMQQNILNKIDAGYNKDLKLINVMTTNYIDRISSFMIRAGRISKLLHVGGIPAIDVLPFCERFMGKMYDSKADYSSCVDILTDMPASFVREIIDEAKTLANSFNDVTISPHLFSTTVKSYKHQEELTLRSSYDPKDKVVDAIRIIFDAVGINPENLTNILQYNSNKVIMSMGKEWPVE